MLSDEVKLFVCPWNRPPFGGLPSGAELSQLVNGDEDSIFKWSPATSWLWNLHHQLGRVGKQTALVERIPDRGVVLICGQDMPLWFRPPKKLLLVSIAADSPLRMFADVHVVQNPMQAERFTSSFRDPASAYREAGDPGQNYLEVSSINDVLTALRCLKNDVVLRRRLVGNGRRQYRAYSEEAVTQVWTRFLDNDLPVISERIRGGGFAYRNMYRQDQILRRIGASLQQRLLPHNSRK